MRLTTIGDGPLVVKLAGLAGGVGLFREECEAAARAGFRVALADTGGDRRDDPAPGPIGWDFLAAETEHAVEAAGGPPAILWGTSYGTLVALAAAARYPALASGLLLCHPPDPAELPRSFRRIRAWASTRSNRVRRATTMLGFGLLTGWEIVYPGLARRLPGLWRANREASTPAGTVREKVDLLWSESPGLPAPGMWGRTSIVAGERDRIAPLGGAKRLASRMTGSRLVVIPRAGHTAAWTHTERYHAICVEELRRLQSS